MFEPFLFIWVFIIMTLQVIAKQDHMYNIHFPWKCSHTRKKKKRFTKEKVLARLGRLTAPRGARPRSFHHEARLHDEKSLVTFPLTLCTAVKKDISSSYLFNSQKCWGSASIGRLAIASTLGELSSEHVVFNI